VSCRQRLKRERRTSKTLRSRFRLCPLSRFLQPRRGRMSETGIQPHPPERTPVTWRAAIAVGIALLALVAYALRDLIGLRGPALVGVFFFFGLVALFSTNLRTVNWRTIGWGIAIQIVLAFLVLKVGYTRAMTDAEKTELQARRAAESFGIGVSGGLEVMPMILEQPPETVTVRPFYAIFEKLGEVVKAFIGFSDEGAKFVFGNLAQPHDIALNPGVKFLFIFAFKALPPILFVSAFFTVLYHYGILQWCVRLMARVMVYLMG